MELVLMQEGGLLSLEEADNVVLLREEKSQREGIDHREFVSEAVFLLIGVQDAVRCTGSVMGCK